jgi:hypothetical protein
VNSHIIFHNHHGSYTTHAAEEASLSKLRQKEESEFIKLEWFPCRLLNYETHCDMEIPITTSECSDEFSDLQAGQIMRLVIFDKQRRVSLRSSDFV